MIRRDNHLLREVYRIMGATRRQRQSTTVPCESSPSGVLPDRLGAPALI